MGLEATGRISTQLSKSGITVISGLALGIDRQAHLGGLRGVGSSVAVLGCGLDVDYPQDNRDVRRRLEEKGLVVTEYGPGVRAPSRAFPDPEPAHQRGWPSGCWWPRPRTTAAA